MRYHFVNVVVDDNNNFVSANISYYEDSFIKSFTINDSNQILWHLNSFAKQSFASLDVLLNNPQKVRIERRYDKVDNESMRFNLPRHNDSKLKDDLKKYDNYKIRKRQVKKITSISLALLIGLSSIGYKIAKNYNIYNNKYIKIINSYNKPISNDIKYLLGNYDSFNRIICDCVNNRYDNLKMEDIDQVCGYLDDMSECNFVDFDINSTSHRVGYIIALQDYFPYGNKDHDAICYFEAFYNDIIRVINHEITGNVRQYMEMYCNQICSYLIDSKILVYSDQDGNLAYSNINSVSDISNLIIFKMAKEVIDACDYNYRSKKGYVYSEKELLNKVEERINFVSENLKYNCKKRSK